MYTGGGRNLELGADSIGARYQHGLFPTLGVEGEKGAKRSDAAKDAAREGARSDAADAVLGLLGSGNIYSGINVTHAGTAFFLSRPWCSLAGGANALVPRPEQQPS